MKQIALTFTLCLFCTLLAAQNATEHVVKRGETFATIAGKYGLTESQLKEANPQYKTCYAGLKLKVVVAPVAQPAQKAAVSQSSPTDSTDLSDGVMKHFKEAKDGYKWYWIWKGDYEGAEDENHNLLIPLSRGYTDVTYISGENHTGFFCVEGKERKEGACDITWKEIIKPIYNNVFYSSTDGFNYETADGIYIALGITLDSEGHAVTNDATTVSGEYTSSVGNTSASSVPTPPDNISFGLRAMLEEAEQQETYANYSKAISIYDKAIKVYGAKGYVLYKRGSAHMHRGKYKQAVKDLQSAVGGNDCSPEIRSMCAQMLSEAQRALSEQRLRNAQIWATAISAGVNSISSSLSGGNTYQPNSVSVIQTVPNAGVVTTPAVSSPSKPKTRVCPLCNGRKSCKTCLGVRQCKHCNGSGKFSVVGGYEKCSACMGSGRCNKCDGRGTCNRCGGTGNVPN